ncbi:helix-turn-helix domain-containing protein [Streptomyces sp. NPDC020330]|uniref:helix-turn-helix domain-containing protein n=1 Tax=unclassified Streptomyces TaxID=2593676 RepID=UPI0037A431DC
MLSKHFPITGTPRRHLGVALRRAYDQGVPIRSLAEICGRSYGFVRQLLLEADAMMSPHGGPRHNRAGQSPWQLGAAACTFRRELQLLCAQYGRSSG